MKTVYQCSTCLRSFDSQEDAIICEEQARVIINGMVQNSPLHLVHFAKPNNDVMIDKIFFKHMQRLKGIHPECELFQRESI